MDHAPTDGRLNTIRALLAKAEATPYPAEAEAFTAKATELMARFAVDEALLWATAPSSSSAPVESTIELLRPFVTQKAVLVHAVATTLGCRSLRIGRLPDNSGERVALIGFAPDVAMVETLVTSLFLQLTSAMTATGAAPAGTASQVAAWRRSFIMGFTGTVTERLEADRRRAVAETEATAAPSTAGASTAVVLRERSGAVEDELHRRYPNIRTARVSAGTSAAGRRAGTSAGRRADLGGTRLAPRRALGA